MSEEESEKQRRIKALAHIRARKYFNTFEDELTSLSEKNVLPSEQKEPTDDDYEDLETLLREPPTEDDREYFRSQFKGFLDVVLLAKKCAKEAAGQPRPDDPEGDSIPGLGDEIPWPQHIIELDNTLGRKPNGNEQALFNSVYYSTRKKEERKS